MIVFGLDTANGPLDASLSRYDPTTGYAGNCDRNDRAEAAAKTPGVTYVAFQVPPGQYVINDFYFTSGPFDAAAGANAFVAPAGKRVYIGTFENETGVDLNYRHPLVVHRDFDAAKVALGSTAAGLELAEAINGKIEPYGYICTP